MPIRLIVVTLKIRRQTYRIINFNAKATFKQSQAKQLEKQNNKTQQSR